MQPTLKFINKSTTSSLRNVVIGGSSITHDHPWPTWSTWIQKRYEARFLDVSVKGLGNEAIISRAVLQAKALDDPLLIVQLTNVDKWDWYVERPTIIQQLSQEKHQITKLVPEDTAGFWSTGSHFPKWKKHYRENYFSLQHHMWHTLLMINWLQMVCRAQKWKLYIVFDSPVLAVTEQQLNQGLLDVKECNSKKLTDNSLCSMIYDWIDWSQIYCPGLIGYAVQKDLPWYNVKIKGHPGSLVHFLFAQDIIVPDLDSLLEPCRDIASDISEAQRMQALFHATC